MLIAVLTDIHGNSIALDVALADAEGLHVNEYWLLGDLVAMGPDPVGTAERLRALEADVMIRGNTDRYVLTGDGPFPSSEQLTLEPALVEQMMEYAATLAWTKGMLTATGHLGWVAMTSKPQERTLPDGTVVLAVHASADRDDGPGIAPDIPDEEVAALFPGVTATLVLGGHTHRETDRTLVGTRFVNPGSISNHETTDKKARYLLIRADEHGVELEHRRVEYDVAAATALIHTSGMPGGRFLIDRFFPS